MKTMIFTKKLAAGFCLLALMIFGFGINNAKASENGEIKVEVFEEDGTPAVQAVVTLLSGDQIIAKKGPDENGVAFFKEVVPGKYDIKVVLEGSVPQLLTGVEVSPGKTAYKTFKLKLDLNLIKGVVEIRPDKKSMTQETMSSGQDIPIDQIQHIAAPKSSIISIIVAVTPSVLPTADGKDIYSRGSRSGSNEYIVDGEKVIGSFNIPSQSIQGMTVYTGGVPACYGDFTGGLVMITTKSFFNGVQQKKQMYEDISNDLKEQQEYQEELKKKKEEEKGN
ncbi:MAG TPA: TonB-dependent receptor [Bacteroidia bacterium]|jgi:hypothetical protein